MATLAGHDEGVPGVGRQVEQALRPSLRGRNDASKPDPTGGYFTDVIVTGILGCSVPGTTPPLATVRTTFTPAALIRPKMV